MPGGARCSLTLRQKGRDRYADIDKWLSRVDEREELLDLVAAYQNLKKERGLVEFGDRMVQALHLVTHHPRVGRS